jgi:accessory colonization factor AcfC
MKIKIKNYLKCLKYKSNTNTDTDTDAVISFPQWHKHQPHNTLIFFLDEGEKIYHRCVLAV